MTSVTFEVEVDAPAVQVTSAEAEIEVALPAPVEAVDQPTVALQVQNQQVGIGLDSPLAQPTPQGSPTVIFAATTGARGSKGDPGGGTFLVGETPSGVLDGSNTHFTTGFDYQGGTVALYLNGLRETTGVGFTEVIPNTIVFSEPPLPGDDIAVDYLVLG